MDIQRNIPKTLIIKMIVGGNFYICQICIVAIILFTRILIFEKFDTAVFLFFLIADVTATMILIKRWKTAYKHIKILQKGVLTKGKYVKSEYTLFKLNYRQIYKHSYTYTGTNKQTFEVYKYSFASREPDPFVDVLYLQEKNEDALVINGLPGKPSLDKEGNITSVSILGNILFYIVMILFFL